MSTNTSIIHSVEKSEESVMLEKKVVLMCTTENEASYSVTFSFFYSFHWENLTAEMSTSFFFPPFKNTTQKTWILCACKSKTSS